MQKKYNFNLPDDCEITLVRSDRRTIAVEIRPAGLIIRAPRTMKMDDIEAFLKKKENLIREHYSKMYKKHFTVDAWKPFTKEEIKAMTEKASKVIPERVKYYAPLVGVDYGRITIRCQRTRWGSCTSKGNMNFNCLLMMTPPEVLDSVVVHELCHRKQMNHSKQFYAEVKRVYPEYDRWHGWLREHGGALIRRRPQKS